jgi:hypothetical protein
VTRHQAQRLVGLCSGRQQQQAECHVGERRSGEHAKREQIKGSNGETIHASQTRAKLRQACDVTMTVR